MLLRGSRYKPLLPRAARMHAASACSFHPCWVHMHMAHSTTAATGHTHLMVSPPRPMMRPTMPAGQGIFSSTSPSCGASASSSSCLMLSLALATLSGEPRMVTSLVSGWSELSIWPGRRTTAMQGRKGTQVEGNARRYLVTCLYACMRNLGRPPPSCALQDATGTLTRLHLENQQCSSCCLL